jgi:branched-chain amino acid aminotransferase
MLSFVSINGQILPASDAKIQVNDLAILRGLGIFDFLRAEKGSPILLDDYLNRFERSAGSVGLPLPINRKGISKEIFELIKLNNLPECGIRIILTGGYSPDGFSPNKSNLIIICEELHFPESWQYLKGAKLLTFEYKREWSEVKSINYFSAVKLLPLIKANFATDILYHHQGYVYEASRSNFFIIKNGTIISPSEGILKGITRKTILGIANKKFTIALRPIKFEELQEAEEAFITSTTKKILPITKINEQEIGDGTPGKISQELIHLYKNLFS